MVRQYKSNGQFYVDCSNCKWTAGASGATEEQAVGVAEQMGFAVVGKFQFCPSCFDKMLDRWKLHNRSVLKEV